MATAETNQAAENDSFSSDSKKMSDLGNSIYEALKKLDHGATRDELVKKFSVPRTTVYDALRPYLDSKMVIKEKREPDKKRRGRKSVCFVVKK